MGNQQSEPFYVSYAVRGYSDPNNIGTRADIQRPGPISGPEPQPSLMHTESRAKYTNYVKYAGCGCSSVYNKTCKCNERKRDGEHISIIGIL